MCTFIRFLHGGQLKGGWLGHLSTSISLFYFFVISETCSSKVMGCTMCVNGTNNLPNCTQCEAGMTLDPQSNECKSNRKSLLICLSIHPSVCLSVCLSLFSVFHMSEKGVTNMYMFMFLFELAV